MNAFKRYVLSSVGTKQLMGLTGLAMCGFLLEHMTGNLLVLVSPQAYNEYGNWITSNHLIYLAEAGLVAILLVHVIRGLAISVRNRLSRPTRYAVASNGEKGTTIVSKTLMLQGILILVFIVLHLITFKFGPNYRVTYNNIEMRDLHRLIVEVFHQPLYVAWYTVALIVLSLHVGHGFYSSLVSLGLSHAKYARTLKSLGLAFDVVVMGGFLILPFYVYFIYRG